MTTSSSTRQVRGRFVPERITSTSPRITLRLRAHETLERHLVRSVVRVSVLLAADLLAFVLVYALAALVRELAGGVGGPSRFLDRLFPVGFLGGWRFAVALLIGLLATRNYGQGDRRRDPVRLLAGVLVATALSLWQNLWIIGVPRVALQFVTTAGVFWVAVLVIRRAVDRVVTEVRRRTGQAERVLFVGDPTDPRAAGIQERLIGEGMVSLGWVNCAKAKGKSPSPEDIWRELQDREADTVVIAEYLPGELLHAAVEASAAAGCRTLLLPHLNGGAEFKPGLAWHHGVPFVELRVSGLSARHLLLKRWIDAIGSAVLLVLLAPLLLLIAILIRLDSPGPVLYRQERVGLGGRVFRVVKFRTMRLGADAEKASVAHLNRTGDPRLFKIPNDPRVTRVGAILRRWSLDEWPQLWNVLVGEMSLVGPRPFPASDVAGYQDHHFLRLAMRPGITGLWQVEGRSEIVDFEEVVRLDRQYVERWSLWLDFVILARTVPAVLRRNGAY